MVAAGILPFAISGRRTFILLGRERFKKGKCGRWSDFGGKREANETVEQTASREAEEEADGLLGNRRELHEKLVKGDDVYGLSSSRAGTYRSFLLKIDYDADLPARFEKQTKEGYDASAQIQDGLYEKDMIAWFEVTPSRRIGCALRPFYGPIVQLHITTLLNLQRLL